MNVKRAETLKAEICVEYNEFSDGAKERFRRRAAEGGIFFAARRLK
jgi:hypothetical protein